MDWKIFFSVLLQEKEMFLEVVPVLDENIFKNAVMTNLFILVKKFFVKYHKIPTMDTLTLLLEKLPSEEKKNLKEYSVFIKELSETKIDVDVDILKNEIFNAIKNFEVEKFILKTANKATSVSFEDILTDIRNVASKFVPKSVGIDVTDVARGIKHIRHDVKDKVTSGIASLDRFLYGGFGTEEIATIIAPPGRGKSFFLLNVMYGAMLAKKNVLYLTCELYEKSVLKRLYSRISYSTRKDMLDEEYVVKSASKFFALTKSKGRILYVPSKSMTVEGVESLLDSQRMYFDFVPDIIIVDYLDLLAPRAADMRLEIRHRLRGITDDLRSLSIRRNVPVLTATQGNRESLAKSKITEANVSEAFGKIEVSDVVLALCQTDEEKKMKRARLLILKNRDYISGACIEVYVDFEKMLLMDLDLANKMGILEEANVAFK